MQADPFTGRPTRVRGSRLPGADEQTALQHDHERGLETLARLRAAAEGVGFGTDPDDDLVLSAEDGLSLLAGADALWDEVGFLAFHLNWTLDELVDLPHGLRQRLVNQARTLARDGNAYG